jgi:hypothetical protein
MAPQALLGSLPELMGLMGTFPGPPHGSIAINIAPGVATVGTVIPHMSHALPLVFPRLYSHQYRSGGCNRGNYGFPCPSLAYIAINVGPEAATVGIIFFLAPPSGRSVIR